MKRIKKYLSVIKPTIYFYLIMFIFTLGIMLINLIINIMIGLNTGEYIFNRDFFETPHLFEVLLYFTLTIIYSIWYRRLMKNEEILIKRKSINVKDICFILFLGLGALFLTYGIMNLLAACISMFSPQVISNYNNLMSYTDEGNITLVVLRTVIMAPIFEELLFRGVTLNRAKNMMSFYATNIFQAFLFGIIHMNIIQLVYTFPKGLLYGYVAFKYQSIIPSILLHIFNNASSLLISNYFDKIQEYINLSIWFFVVQTLVGVLLFTISYFVIKRKTNMQESAVEEV